MSGQRAWVDVAAAVIADRTGRILLTRRREDKDFAGMWEFPGGKVELAETPKEALVRELQEELGLAVSNVEPLITVPHHYGQKSIRLIMFRCDTSEQPQAREGQAMTWVPPERLDRYRMPAADRPVCAAVQSSPWYWVSPQHDAPEMLPIRVTQALDQGFERFWLRPPFATPEEVRIQDDWQAAIIQAVTLIHEQGGTAMVARDIALATQMKSGLHLSSDQLQRFAQGFWQSDFLTEWKSFEQPLAASCHSSAALQQASKVGCDFATISPIKSTPKYGDQATLGWAGFERLRATSDLPLYALGGLTKNDLSDARAVGAQGIAAIRGFRTEEFSTS